MWEVCLLERGGGADPAYAARTIYGFPRPSRRKTVQVRRRFQAYDGQYLMETRAIEILAQLHGIHETPRNAFNGVTRP